jgi:hypothetical protein
MEERKSGRASRGAPAGGAPARRKADRGAPARWKADRGLGRGAAAEQAHAAAPRRRAGSAASFR